MTGPGIAGIERYVADGYWRVEYSDPERFTFHGTFGGLRRRWRTVAGRRDWVTGEGLDGLLVQALAAPQEMAQDAPEQPVASDRDEEGAEIAVAHLRASASRQQAALLRDAETAAQRYGLLMRALQDEVAQSLLQLEYERMRVEEDEEDIALLLLH